jgi:hypothetical protein
MATLAVEGAELAGPELEALATEAEAVGSKAASKLKGLFGKSASKEAAVAEKGTAAAEAETARVAGAKSFWRLLGEVVPSKRLQQDEKKRVSTPAAGQAVPTTQGTQRGPRSSSRRKKKRKSRTEGVDPKTSQ